MTDKNIQAYIQEIDRQYRTGLAREHSYRPALQQLLAALLPQLTVTNEPARIACGAPDFIITRKSDALAVAFLEAKDIDDQDLDGKRQHKEQFDRYKSSLASIVFTDYLDFHLYEQGELVQKVRLAEMEAGHICLVKEDQESFVALVERLGKTKPQPLTSATKLALTMAAKARLLAITIQKSFDDENHNYESQQLRGQMEAIKRVLIHDITPAAFANIYAQTIAYGMFAARLHDTTPETFSRQEAATLIPKTNPFLRQIFQSIAGYDLDERITWIADDLAATFQATDVERVMRGYAATGQHTDPMIHFYEDFLSAYNPKLRKSKGVWYTPQPVVSFIVRAVDSILVKDFNLPMGLADYSTVERNVVNEQYEKGKKGEKPTMKRKFHRVQILDPATGTGTFLAEVVRRIYAKFSGQEGLWQNYVAEHLLPRLNGFELLMASYAIAHLKLDMLLTETGYHHSGNSRLRIYLTNSLEECHPDTGSLFAQWLSREANEANHIKHDTPVMVMIGNPPYNGSSTNKGEWIMRLMEDYKKEPGGKLPLQERNPKWLNDDYVKFLRMAQSFIERNGTGLLAFINPHGYLDNPTFRGMRWNLLRTYDDIYTVNLHGNSKKKEACPDGSKDENVFDIMQGVSINLFVKTGRKTKNELARVHYYDLYGLRQQKYNWLSATNLSAIPWQDISPKAPMYFFVPKDFGLEEEYNAGFGVNELFALTLLGPNSHRDNFAVAFTKEEADRRISDFANKDNTDLQITEKYHIADNRDWNIRDAREGLTGKERSERCLYRPFDFRYMLYGDFAYDYLRPQVNDNLLRPNVALIYTKQTKENFSAFVSNVPLGQHKIVTPYDGSYFSPLYCYNKGNSCADSLFSTVGATTPSSLSSTETNTQEGVRNETGTLLSSPSGNIEATTGASPHSDKGISRLTSPASYDNKGADKLYSATSIDCGDGASPILSQHRCPMQGGAFIPNFRPEIVKKIEQTLGEQVEPQELFDYIYAVLHSPKYRERYREFLKIDFPRIPYPASNERYHTLAKLGARLRRLHLMQGADSWQTGITYPITGNDEVTQPRFVAEESKLDLSTDLINSININERKGIGRVYLNETQYFGNVPEAAWQFFVGGYQPAQKWLKDRKGRILTFADICHYEQIIFALTETQRIMQEIDAGE